ncbi:BTAD domain-containing putative transcriptional regulator [Streptomyces sp. NPDC051776]|uniref:AfsR/SARP family transcriptional regulator n=1 Tax=Streptomyces sp. NPDC051776 TaxID=3155414 RepID=UPI003425B6A9
MRFQLLGPLSITDGPESVVLAPSKPTILLASLLLHANSVVSAEYLLRTVWGEVQPATAKAALQTCVLRLRRLFAKHGVTETPIEAVPGGYRIVAGEQHLDLIGFRECVRRAARLSHDPETELDVLKSALALWQGSLLANVRSDVLHRDEVPRLTEERLRCVERACDLELALGRCGEALVELWSATRAHPGHERFREQLIECLYRTGRQTEALAEYRRVKEYLLEELGVDPSPALQRLELAILRGDDLGPASGKRPAPQILALTAEPAKEEKEPAPATSAPAAPAAPAVLPSVPTVPSFSGRSAEVAAMAARLTGETGGPATVLVSGAPGIGKTALACHVAQLVRDRFPGGRFLVTMTGPGGEPRRPAEVSAELEEFRARNARNGGGDRILLVLDDVVNAGQVRPLLPSAPGAAAVVTSRRGLAGLVATHGGSVHRLGAFDEAESRELLVAVLGTERVDAEPDAARQLAAVCAHYPLALRILTARLLTRPGLGLADSVRWLADDPMARLSLTDDPGMSVEQVLGEALDRLGPSLADAFLRIGARSHDKVRTEDTAEALGLPVAEAEEVLERLAEAGLLEEGPPGPYRMHELLRIYARRASQHTQTTQKV